MIIDQEGPEVEMTGTGSIDREVDRDHLAADIDITRNTEDIIGPEAEMMAREEPHHLDMKMLGRRLEADRLQKREEL